MDDGGYPDTYPDALACAARWHRSQRKKGKSKIPYISHLLTVSALVWEDGGNTDEAIAALLHDSLEDIEELDKTDIESRFGSLVADIVDDCSDATPAPGETKEPWFRRKVHHIEKITDVLETGRADSTLRVIGADKLANARSVIVDMRRRKGDFWRVFKGGLGGSVWYYEQMARLVANRHPGSMISSELDLAVGLLKAEVDRIEMEVSATSAAIRDCLIGPGRDLLGHRGDGVPGAEMIERAHELLAFELARRVAHDGASDSDPATAVASVLLGWFGDSHQGVTDSRDSLPESLRGTFDAVMSSLAD